MLLQGPSTGTGGRPCTLAHHMCRDERAILGCLQNCACVAQNADFCSQPAGSLCDQAQCSIRSVKIFVLEKSTMTGQISSMQLCELPQGPDLRNLYFLDTHPPWANPMMRRAVTRKEPFRCTALTAQNRREATNTPRRSVLIHLWPEGPIHQYYIQIQGLIYSMCSQGTCAYQ